MSTSLLERPFGTDLMVPVGELVNGPLEMKTGYTTTYVKDSLVGEVRMASSQKKDDDEDE